MVGCYAVCYYATLGLLSLALYCVAASELQEDSLWRGAIGGSGSIIYVNGTDSSAANNETCWEGHPTLPCKNLTFALHGAKDSTTIVIAEGEYYIRPDPSLTLVGINTIALEGHGMFTDSGNDAYPPVRVICDNHAGLTFINSSQVTIQNIEFTSCGGLHPSTSRNYSNTATFSFLEFPAALYFLFCSDISFNNVMITHSNGTGVALYSTVGTNIFQGCNFSYNSVIDGPYPGGGGLYIEFPYCSPMDPAACNNGIPAILSNYSSNAKYIINASYFGYNSGNMTHPIDFSFLLAQDKTHLSFGRGGGLSIFFSDARNVSVEVHDSIFEANTAYWGAGVFVEFQGKSCNNTFTMNSCTIKNNECRPIKGYNQTTGGGGARLGYIFLDSTYVSSNHMKFENCNFSGNLAYWGGGVSLNAARETNKTQPSNTLEFVDCNWSSNMGRTGSAVDLSLWNYPSSGVTIEPTFTNCIFKDNDDKYGESIGNIIGLGTVYVDSLPIVFEQSVHFEGNQRSALVAVESMVDFSEGCVANFSKNSGRTGGAISLFGYAFIRVSENTELYFIKNSASQYGGAINSRAVGQHGLVSFGNCFIQYHNASVEPSNWTALFYFDGNRAGYTGGPNSISAISLIPCLWGSYRPSEHSSNQTSRMLFCGSDNWQYVNQTCDNEISSAPASFSNNQTKYSIKAIPGKPCPMGIRTYDDSGKESTNRTVLNAVSHSPDIKIPDSSLYISDDTIVLSGQPNTNGTLGIQTFIPRVLHTEIEVELLPCPPGFVLSMTSTCICGGTYSGAVLCREIESKASLQNGHWMGSYNESGNTSRTVVGVCGYTITSVSEEFVPLTDEKGSLDAHLCNKSGRTGVLCGDCLPGYGPALNTRFYKCVNCTSDQAKYNWIFFVLSAFVPVTVFFFIVVIFHISATRGIANAFIFFAQVLTTTFDIDGDGTIPLRNITNAADKLKIAYTIPYEIWNLDFFNQVLPSYCLSPNIRTLGLISLNYLIAAYPLLLIFIFYAFVSLYNRGIQPIFCLCRPVHQFFARWQRSWNLQRSTVDAFATFLVLSYTKFTVVSVFLLTPIPLVDDGGNTVAWVLYYDGNIRFLSKEHIPFFLLALFVLVIFVLVPPIFLLVYPLKVTQKVASCIGLKRLCRIETGGRLQMFLDTFQGCYKNGTDDSQDHRYFAGIYFVLRTVLFSLYAYASPWIKQYIAQQLICTAGIMLFAIMRPYKKNFYNNLDATVFSILAAINTLSIYNCYLSTVALPLSTWAFALQYILIFCPMIFMSGYVVYHIWKANRNRLKPLLKKAVIKCCCCLQLPEDGVGLISLLSDAGTPSSSVIDEDFLSFANTVEACGRDKSLNYHRHPSSDPSSVSHPSSSEVEPASVRNGSNSEAAPLIRTVGKKKKSSQKTSITSADYGSKTTTTDKQQGATSSKTTE